jgi:hypothetical protein
MCTPPGRKTNKKKAKSKPAPLKPKGAAPPIVLAVYLCAAAQPQDPGSNDEPGAPSVLFGIVRGKAFLLDRGEFDGVRSGSIGPAAVRTPIKREGRAEARPLHKKRRTHDGRDYGCESGRRLRVGRSSSLLVLFGSVVDVGFLDCSVFVRRVGLPGALS